MAEGRRVCSLCGHHTTEPVCPFDGAPTAEASTTWLGRTIDGRYRIDAPLGSGGMGAVFRATQLPVERPVAVKLLRASEASEALATRFRREARAIAALRHPQIVQLIEFGEAESGEHYLVMELIEGRTLEAVIASDAPLPEQRVARIGAGIAKGLACAHDGGVVHRDLKPANIMLTDHAGERDFVRILDFGIAQLAGPEAAASFDLTGTNAILGTPRYLSPEQARGEAVVPQTDLYALGLVLYELLTGRSPFDASSLTGWLMAHVQEEPAPLVGSDGRSLAGALPALVLRCLAKDPSQRPESARAVLAALEQIAAGASEARSVRRPPAVVFAVVSAVVGATLVTGLVLALRPGEVSSKPTPVEVAAEPTVGTEGAGEAAAAGEAPPAGGAPRVVVPATEEVPVEAADEVDSGSQDAPGAAPDAEPAAGDGGVDSGSGPAEEAASEEPTGTSKPRRKQAAGRSKRGVKQTPAEPKPLPKTSETVAVSPKPEPKPAPPTAVDPSGALKKRSRTLPRGGQQ